MDPDYQVIITVAAVLYIIRYVAEAIGYVVLGGYKGVRLLLAIRKAKKASAGPVVHVPADAQVINVTISGAGAGAGAGAGGSVRYGAGGASDSMVASGVAHGSNGAPHAS